MEEKQKKDEEGFRALTHLIAVVIVAFLFWLCFCLVGMAITWCFGLEFSWRVATGVWIIATLVWIFISACVKK